MLPSKNGDQVKNEVLGFYETLAKDPNHRYRSWEHCYDYFSRHAAWTDADHDVAALHLAFYLASWGMYRGSSALLWKDYKIHGLAILELLEPKYEGLWRLNLDDSSCDAACAELIVSLSDELKKIYEKQFTTVNGNPSDRKPSEILITKILLGTVGCTPACDRFFISGFRHQKLQYSAFNETFLCRVFQFYREQTADLLETQRLISERGNFDYPIMKLIDMYFWNLGAKLLPESKETEEFHEA